MMAAQHGTVIVTGSSGFIGAALINKLSSGISLVGFDRMASSGPPPAAECVCIDLTSEDAVKAAFERVHIAYGDRIASVVHLAAYYDLSGAPSPLYEQITVRGTERLLEHLQGFEVEQFIFSSTMLVHAPTQPGQTINEDSPIDARWAYPQSKVETEALIREKPATFRSFCSGWPAYTTIIAIRRSSPNRLPEFTSGNCSVISIPTISTEVRLLSI
jgi:nucleoside-diphosphate-sugar epimerase